MAKKLDGLKVFLSGPIEGMRDASRPFSKAAKKARKAGAVDVFNPVTSCAMFQMRQPGQYARYRLHEVTRGDLQRDEFEYDVVLMLDGWRESAVCVAEAAAAMVCGLEVIELWEME